MTATLLERLKDSATIPSTGQVKYAGGHVAWSGDAIDVDLGTGGTFRLHRDDETAGFIQLSRSHEQGRDKLHLSLRTRRGERLFLWAHANTEQVEGLSELEAAGVKVSSDELMRVLDVLRAYGARVTEQGKELPQRMPDFEAPPDPLDALAERGATQKRKLEEREQRQRKRRAERESKKEDESVKMLRRSIRSRIAILEFPLLMIVMFGGMAISMVSFGDTLGGFAFVIAIVGSMALSLGILYLFGWIGKIDHEKEQRKLEEQPIPFDHASYERALMEHNNRARLTAYVRFEEPPGDIQRLADAVVGAMPKSKTSNRRHELVITSPAYKTCTHGKSTTTYHNDRLHWWWRRCLKRALEPIHASQPIADITFSVEYAG